MVVTYEVIHYEIVPPLFMVVFTSAVQLMAVLGGGDSASWSLIGNWFSWMVVGTMMLWALASLWVPAKTFEGPITSFGLKPQYKANGVGYFFVSLFSSCFLFYLYPDLAVQITHNFPQILASCTVMGFALCVYLYHQGKNFPQSDEKLEPYPVAYEFYRGMELHPRLLGVDVKQLTNCRFGLMAWQILLITFFVTCCVENGFRLPLFVTVLLQTIYLFKFYLWETGYFDTLDMTLDRAGYYLCWGCLVWVPTLFPFVAYYLTSRKPLVSDSAAWLILIFGVVVIALNYRVDWEKQYFKASNGLCRLWGRPASFIKCVLSDAATKGGKGGNVPRKSYLLTSGFWGFARHMNYTFEILIALSWSLPALGYGIWPFMYPVFIAVLAFHRLYRDEEKCSKKYGKHWKEYCDKVPYRLIPGLF